MYAQRRDNVSILFYTWSPTEWNLCDMRGFSSSLACLRFLYCVIKVFVIFVFIQNPTRGQHISHFIVKKKAIWN